MSKSMMLVILVTAALAGASGTAFAESADLQGGPAPTGGSALADMPSLDGLKPLGETDLKEADGGQQVTAALSEQALTAVTSGNSIRANSVGSGSVSFDANAFQGFAGVGNLVINTGHNNNLQGALSVNIVITP